MIELFWVLHDLAAGKYHNEHPVFHDAALAARARAFLGPQLQDEECGFFDEVLVLAAAHNLLTTPDTEAFIEKVPSLAQQPIEEAELATESEETRRAIFFRLAQMRGDAKMRSEFQALLRDAWDAIRDTWEMEGRQIVEQTCTALRARLAAGAELADVTTPRHMALESRFRSLAERAVARGDALLVPCYFGGHSLVFDLPGGTFLIGMGAQNVPRAQQLRRAVQAGATRLKVLADPTRMAILAYLTDSPSSVTELARAFSIAQPTASAHIRMLRDTHLIQPVHEASKVRYQVARDELEGLLALVRGNIFGPS